ncbi:MAG: LLM class flavin-dependent oxidoreductase, partial [Nitrospinota bacterium]
RGARMNLRPLQKPHPPIWIAANSDPAVRRAARLGDTWFINPHASYETIRAQVTLFREERERAGKPMPEVLPMIKELYVAEDREKALRECGPYLAQKYKVYAQWGQDRALPGEESFEVPFEELAGGRFILGSPEECFEQLRPYAQELGVNYLVFRMQWPGMPQALVEKNIRLADEALVPELRKL